MRTLIAVALLPLLTTVALAQPDRAAIEAKRTAMAKLDFMLGSWEGPATFTLFGPRPTEAHGTETIKQEIDGLAFVIRGKFTAAIPDGTERVVHDALAILSYDPQQDVYKMQAHLGNGQSGEYQMRLIDERTVQWEMETPMGQMRYTISYEDDTWSEIGEISRSEGSFEKFFEMKLKKTD